MFRRSMSVRLRLMLWNVGLLALLLVALCVVVRVTTQAAIGASVDRRLDQRSIAFVEHWRRFDRDRLFAPPWYRYGQPRPVGPPLERADTLVRFWPRTLDTNGHAYLPWSYDRPWDAGAVAMAASCRNVSTSIWVDGEQVRVHSIPLYKDETVVGVMQIASSLADLDQVLSVLTITMFALSPFILLACGLTGAAITGHAMRPVRTMVDASPAVLTPGTCQSVFRSLAATISRSWQ